MSRRLVFILIVALVGSVPAIAGAADGAYPQDLVVSPDGNHVLVTSTKSNYATVVRPGGAPEVDWVDLGSMSWDACMIGGDRAVVTHPHGTYLSVLDWSAGTGFTPGSDLQGVPLYCTEIIPAPAADHVFIADRGAPSPLAAEWTHTVREYDLGSGLLETRTFITEREPAALAVSPDGDWLIVGTFQGALGGAGLVSPQHSLFAGASYRNDVDGGSILIYDLSDTGAAIMPVERIAVGSPVRGLAVLDDGDGFKLYYTSVGFGSESEDPDPDFGGRNIPNVISCVDFDADGDAVSLTEAIFGHEPNNHPNTLVDGKLPLVLHEKIALRANPFGFLELWVSNSGSGTVSRILAMANGDLVVNGTETLPVLALPSRDTAPFVLPSHAINTSVTYDVLVDIDSPSFHQHVDLTDIDDNLSRFTSQPKGLVVSDDGDDVWCVTRLGQELWRLTPQSTGVVTTATYDVSPGTTVGTQERNFFGFGRGFAFRELTSPATTRVGTITCGTCHPNGHLDGKVRFTRRQGDNLSDGGSDLWPVAVPSVRDVGQTEWLFFEGLRTIRDLVSTTATDSCNYCGTSQFFLNTVAFTNTLETEIAPEAPDGDLAGASLRGRFLFEALNCNRCHTGATPSFLRTNEVAPQFAGATGPLPGSLSGENRILHDATQSFITFVNAAKVDLTNNHSLRNMTNVGTRQAATCDCDLTGVNTPGLAGAWDNRPYMHDGRYRTLDQVLQNTWLRVNDDHRAAPLVSSPLGIPDNALKDPDVYDEAVALGTLPLHPSSQLYAFNTHKPATMVSPGDSLVTVADYLTATQLDDLKTFLFSASAQTDLCDEDADASDLFSAITATADPFACTMTLSWTTAVPTVCDYTISPPLDGIASGTSGPGMNHTIVMDMTDHAMHRIDISAPTLCGEEATTYRKFTATYCVSTGKTAPITRIESIRPNPTSSSATVAFSLAQAGGYSLKVFDLQGRLVRTLAEENLQPGQHVRAWEGSFDDGARAPAGVYFMHFRAGEYEETRKVMVVK